MCCHFINLVIRLLATHSSVRDTGNVKYFKNFFDLRLRCKRNGGQTRGGPATGIPWNKGYGDQR